METKARQASPTRYTMREAALWYAAHGLAAIPLQGKVPTIADWQHARPQDTAHHHWADGCNVGVVCGAASGGLVILDFDDLEKDFLFCELFPDLLNTCVVKSRRGYHRYYHSDELPVSRKLPGVDLLSTGRQAVAPPSIHPDTGQPYIVLRRRPIMHLVHLRAVVEWMEAQRPAGVSRIPAPPDEPVKHRTRYGEAALADELRTVRQATAGNRNTQLYVSGLKLFSLVISDMLDYASVADGLLDAARDNHYIPEHGEGAALKTIKSAWDRAEARRSTNGR